MTLPTTKVDRFAPAKINLTLHITGRRDDGYHLLESLVVFAKTVGDRISVSAADQLTVTVDGPAAEGVPQGDDNLVLKAARHLADLRSVTTGAAITLQKHLPSGAGIGGGSSDAAAALSALAELWDVAPLSAAEAVPLGADVPVCMAAPAPMLMSGIGEQLQPAGPLPEMWLCLVNPGVHLPTPQVFAQFKEAFGDTFTAQDPLPEDRDMDSFSLWLLQQQNMLTPCAADLTGAVPLALSYFWNLEDYIDADMSGSGSTCWGMFETEAEAQDIARTIREDNPQWWVKVTQVAS